MPLNVICLVTTFCLLTNAAVPMYDYESNNLYSPRDYERDEVSDVPGRFKSRIGHLGGDLMMGLLQQDDTVGRTDSINSDVTEYDYMGMNNSDGSADPVNIVDTVDPLAARLQRVCLRLLINPTDMITMGRVAWELSKKDVEAEGSRTGEDLDLKVTLNTRTPSQITLMEIGQKTLLRMIKESATIVDENGPSSRSGAAVVVPWPAAALRGLEMVFGSSNNPTINDDSEIIPTDHAR